MLSLRTRDARLGKKYSGKPLKAKDPDSPRTLTFEIEEIELDAHELGVLLQEPHAHSSLYNHTRDGIRPFLKCFKALELDGAIDGAYVAVSWLSAENDFRFTSAKLTGVKLTLGADEGKTFMRTKVTVEPALNTHGTGEQSEKPKPRGRGRKNGSPTRALTTHGERP